MPNQRVLVVEDNPDDEALTRRAFRRNVVAAEVVVKADGPSALDWLREVCARPGETLPAFVLLDINLPIMSGHEVLRVIRADDRLRSLPVVMFSSSNEEADLRASYVEGASSYVRKPLDFDAFMSTVGQVGSYWLGINQLPGAAA